MGLNYLLAMNMQKGRHTDMTKRSLPTFLNKEPSTDICQYQTGNLKDAESSMIIFIKLKFFDRVN